MSAEVVEAGVEVVSVTEVLDGASGRVPMWIAAGELFNKISSATSMVLIDLRRKENYDRMHIRTAFNIDWSGVLRDLDSSDFSPDGCDVVSHVEAHMSSSSKARFRMRRYFEVVLYGGQSLPLTQDQDDPPADSDLVLSFAQALYDEGKVTKSVFLLEGGFEAFVDSKPFLVQGHPSCPPVQFNYPNEIIEDFLYLGSFDSASTHRCLTDLRITHILNVTDDCDCCFQSEFKYLQCPIDDNPHVDISLYFDTATEFIGKVKSAEVSDAGRVLVHCKMGMSRSSAVVIAYLMKTRHWSLKKTFHFVQSKRSFINPNYGFLKHLQCLEESIFGKTTISFPDPNKPARYQWVNDE